MYTLFFTFLFLLMTASVHSQENDPLKKYRWKNRVILLFASSPDQPELLRQKEILSGDTAGIRDRDLVVHTILPDTPWQYLRDEYSIRESFAFILIGKDGGVKKRSNSAVSRESLYSLIDSMPMRQAEMKRKNH